MLFVIFTVTRKRLEACCKVAVYLQLLRCELLTCCPVVTLKVLSYLFKNTIAEARGFETTALVPKSLLNASFLVSAKIIDFLKLMLDRHKKFIQGKIVVSLLAPLQL